MQGDLYAELIVRRNELIKDAEIRLKDLFDVKKIQIPDLKECLRVVRAELGILRYMESVNSVRFHRGRAPLCARTAEDNIEVLEKELQVKLLAKKEEEAKKKIVVQPVQLPQLQSVIDAANLKRTEQTQLRQHRSQPLKRRLQSQLKLRKEQPPQINLPKEETEAQLRQREEAEALLLKETEVAQLQETARRDRNLRRRQREKEDKARRLTEAANALALEIQREEEEEEVRRQAARQTEELKRLESVPLVVVQPHIDAKNKERESQQEKCEQLECSVCMDNRKDRVCVPCGHLFCGTCVGQMHLCGICRTPITSTMKVYL